MKQFEPKELVLVDIENLKAKERWVPAEYICRDPFRILQHVVKLADNTTFCTSDECIRKATKPIELDVIYIVYVDSAYDSDVLTFSCIEDAEEAALKLAHRLQKAKDQHFKDVTIEKQLISRMKMDGWQDF